MDAPIGNAAPQRELASPPDELLHFQISTGLKRVLGRELITDDEVAVFELVKNSFDADARNVFVRFAPNAIMIADDGSGMSLRDIREKWLFVAYSAKRDANRTDQSNFRDDVAARHHYAGSKGVGRFSSDRLGTYLILQTRPNDEALVHRLEIDWAQFDEDDKRQFGNVNVTYKTTDDFELPADISARQHGTVIEIKNLQREWSRDSLLRLRSGLAKLINPFGDAVDGFGITLIAEREKQADAAALKKHEKMDEDKRPEAAPVVNGKIDNFIFSTLLQKTTLIDVRVDPETNMIVTSLTDRGELIYRIREENEYPRLRYAEFQCQLYYLNRAAKATFARRVGVPAVRFGSVFVFRNGFRVFPIGEEGDDWFDVDRRKQQGYARFLGTRDIIGRIDVAGSEDAFKEASSRNQGLIMTPAVDELRRCFREHCLKRLERYVVPVSWGTKDVDTETLAVIETDSGRARVAAAVAALIGSEDVEMLDYSKRLINVLNERSDQFEASLANLRLIADTTGDHALADRVAEAEERFTELKRSEAEARRVAEEERRAKQEAEARAAEAEAKAAAAHQRAEETYEQLHEERKRNLFLTSIAALDHDTIEDMHHLVTIYATDLQQQIELLMLKVAKQTEVSREFVVNGLEPIAFLNRKVLAVAKFATKANFRIDSEHIEEDIADYLASYITEVAVNVIGDRLAIEVTTDERPMVRKFKPIDVAILVDNLVSNARRAKATKVWFNIEQPRKGVLEMTVRDDGRGVTAAALEDGRLFEKGYTTTSGSGLGLYHVRLVVSELGGSIEVKETSARGTTFLVRISA